MNNKYVKANWLAIDEFKKFLFIKKRTIKIKDIQSLEKKINNLNNDWFIDLKVCNYYLEINKSKNKLKLKILFKDLKNEKYIEASAYNEIAEKLILKIKENFVYRISNVKQQLLSTIHSKRSIKEINISNYELLIESSENIQIIEANKIITNLNRKKKSNSKTKDEYMVVPVFIKLENIKNLPLNSLNINLYAIIIRKDEIQSIKINFKGKKDNKTIKLLNVFVNDTSNCEFRVAFWDYQAINFKYKTGCVLMMFDLELKKFNETLYLNATHLTRFMEIEESFQFENCEEIRKWFKQKYNS